MKKLLFISLLILTLLAANVLAADSLDITTSSLTLSGDPGTVIPGTFQVSNTGTTNLSISFDQLTLTSGSHSLTVDNINTINLNFGASQNVNFALSNTNVYAATYSGNIRAYKTGDTSVSDTVPIQVTINQDPSLTATNPTLEVAQGFSKQTTFTVTNDGNTDLNSITIQVGTITDGTNVLPSSSISLNPNSISGLAFGAASQVTVNVNIPAAQTIGTYTGPITLNYGGSNVYQATLTVTVDTPEHKVEITNSEVKLGSSTQERDQTIQTTFIVKNAGDYSENSIGVQLKGVASKYSASLSQTSAFNLNVDAQNQITLTATIPDDEDSGISTIGYLEVSYNNGVTFTKEVRLEVETMLAIDDLDIKVGEEEDQNVNDGETIGEPARPGDELEFNFDIKNLYSSSDDIEFENVEIIVTIENIDDGDDLEESVEIDNEIREGDEKAASLRFTVPEKLDEGEYDVVIEVEGYEVESNAKHTILWNLILEVEKKTHDVQITRAELGTDTLQCARSTTLRVTIANFGSRYEKDAALTIYSQEMGINVNIADIELDEDYDDDDNEFSKTVNIDLANDFEAGTYPIDIRAFYNNDDQTDRITVNLKVEDCNLNQQSDDEDQEEQDVVVQTSPGLNQSTTQSTTSSNVIETVETSFVDSGLFIIILLVANIVLVIGILALAFKYLI